MIALELTNLLDIQKNLIAKWSMGSSYYGINWGLYVYEGKLVAAAIDRVSRILEIESLDENLKSVMPFVPNGAMVRSSNGFIRVETVLDVLAASPSKIDELPDGLRQQVISALVARELI